jgi:soluble epoxide hydrolase / lipid-phosphate phosphatase
VDFRRLNIMDASLYKTYQTCRGINYSYFFSPPRNGERTILFIHGFPSTSQDWHKQVAFFIGQGYGALVPDQLGYGGTDKPTIEELDKFKHNLIAKDMVELLDHEQVGPAVSIGHDWYVDLHFALCYRLSYHTGE